MLGEHTLGPDDEPFTLGRQTLEVLPAIDEGDAQLAFQLGNRRRLARLNVSEPPLVVTFSLTT